jgi:hypothetical protein
MFIISYLLKYATAGSRSGSPSSRYSYKTYDSTGTPGRHADSGTLGRPRRLSSTNSTNTASLGPRSSNASREQSPNRVGNQSILKARYTLLINFNKTKIC